MQMHAGRTASFITVAVEAKLPGFRLLAAGARRSAFPFCLRSEICVLNSTLCQFLSILFGDGCCDRDCYSGRSKESAYSDHSVTIDRVSVSLTVKNRGADRYGGAAAGDAAPVYDHAIEYRGPLVFRAMTYGKLLPVISSAAHRTAIIRRYIPDDCVSGWESNGCLQFAGVSACPPGVSGAGSWQRRARRGPPASPRRRSPRRESSSGLTNRSE